MDAKYATVASRIKQARLRKGLSQEQAANAIGTSRFHWIRWEQGLHRPAEYAGRLSEFLGIPEDELRGGDDDDEESALSREQNEILAALMTALARAGVKV